MKKMNKLFAVTFLTGVFMLGISNTADAKFWGKEQSIVAYVGGKVCTTTDTYRFGIKVSSETECEQLPPSGLN